MEYDDGIVREGEGSCCAAGQAGVDEIKLGIMIV